MKNSACLLVTVLSRETISFPLLKWKDTSTGWRDVHDLKGQGTIMRFWEGWQEEAFTAPIDGWALEDRSPMKDWASKQLPQASILLLVERVFDTQSVPDMSTHPSLQGHTDVPTGQTLGGRCGIKTFDHVLGGRRCRGDGIPPRQGPWYQHKKKHLSMESWKVWSFLGGCALVSTQR